MAWFSKRSPEEKAEDFDRIDEIVTRQAKEKQARGEYPYDQDAAAKGFGKLVEPKEARRGKGKHRK